jgi:pimeloyl-ACP methyl ester carboxylesterase
VRRAAAAGCLLALLLPACGGGPASAPTRTIRFTSEDGVRLTGDLRGHGLVGVVLAHMFPADRGSWAEFASLLAGEGYRALNFDFRGYGGSGGTRAIPEMWRDVLAAADELRARGARRVVLVGASMGGTAALVAASRADLDGVVTLSAPSTFMNLSAPPEVVQAVDEPKLFIAAQGDGQAAATAQEFYTEASGAKRVEIVTGDEHGTDLLEGSRAEVVRMAILTFLGTQVAPT